MRSWHTGVYVATSTGGIQGHLLSRHGIADPEDEKPEPSEVLPQEEEVPLTHCEICGLEKDDKFNAAEYRQQYIDWTIKHNIAVYTASYPDTSRRRRNPMA